MLFYLLVSHSSSFPVAHSKFSRPEYTVHQQYQNRRYFPQTSIVSSTSTISSSNVVSQRRVEMIRAECVYFEVRIISRGSEGVIVVGIANQNLPENQTPGKVAGSAGFAADDGR